jgi:hypothetical protein
VRPIRFGILVASLALAAAPAFADDPTRCASETDPVDGGTCVVTTVGRTVSGAEEPTVGPRDAARVATDALLAEQGLCDPVDPAACLLPFPNDFFTVADRTTATGRRVNINVLAMPRNTAGKPIDPTEWNRNDGWSPGTPVLTAVPGVDLAKSGTAPITDIGASLAPDAPIVLIDAATGARHPYFAELDANPTAGEQPVLIVRPAVNFAEGTRYVVALRDLKNASGATIPANATFAARRDAAAAKWHPVKGKGVDKEARAQVLADPVFGPLAGHGYELGDLYLAWTFTIASDRNLTGRMLHIRDDAFASLAPRRVAGVHRRQRHRLTPPGRQHRPRRQGTFTVPLYLTQRRPPRQPQLSLLLRHLSGRPAPARRRRRHDGRVLHLQHPALDRRPRHRPGGGPPRARVVVRPRPARRQDEVGAATS